MKASFMKNKNEMDDSQKSGQARFILIETFVENLELAEKLSVHLVQKNLVSCANITDNVLSIYRWEGKIERCKESKVSLKAKITHYKEIEKTIEEFSTYDVPCIYSTEIDEMNMSYQAFIKEVIRD